MRPLLRILMIPVCLLLQTATAPRSFPIPENMQYEFPGVTLSDSDASALEKAFAADLLKQDWSEKKATSEEFPSAPISLGKRVHGVLVKGNADCLGGATGQSNMFVYVQR